MYILYLDESGDPNGWSTQNHFVLAGVAIHEGQIHSVAGQLDQIQHSVFPDISIPIAFHATDIRAGKGRYRALAVEDREALLGSICEVLAMSSFPNLIAFATVMHVSAVSNSDQVLHNTYQDICQRFNTFLVRQFNKGYPDKGLLIIDKAHQERYRQLTADFRRNGTEYGYLGNIVDIPYFASRHDTRMLQLADMCAHAVFRYYEAGERSYFDQILPTFDRKAPNQPAVGLKHFTKISCKCEACH